MPSTGHRGHPSPGWKLHRQAGNASGVGALMKGPNKQSIPYLSETVKSLHIRNK